MLRGRAGAGPVERCVGETAHRPAVRPATSGALPSGSRHRQRTAQLSCCLPLLRWV